MHTLRFFVLVTCVGAGLLTGGRAHAHALHAKVDVTNDPAKLEAYYDEEMPAEFADVTVTDANGAVVLTGKTDERGIWTFARPKPGKYTLKVEQTGHAAREPFEVAGAPDPGTPKVYGGRRLNKWVGLSVGVAVLLGVSGATWLRRRRVRRLE